MTERAETQKGDTARDAAPEKGADRGAPADGRTARLPGEGPAGGIDFVEMLRIADELPVMIAWIDRDQCYQFVNKAYADWLELPRARLLGRPLREILGDETYESRRPMIEAGLAGERQFFVSSFAHQARGPLSVQIEYVPHSDCDGRVTGLLVMLTDVTEQRLAERALRESEERFRRVANQAPVLMWVTRRDRTRDFVNDAYLEFLGMDREAARQFDWRGAIHPDDFDRIHAESLAGEESGETFTLEGRFRRADGEWRWLKSVSSPRLGPDGEIVGFIGAATDITLAKESEAELKRQVEERTRQLAASEAQFRAVFEAALEVMVLLRPDGTVIAVNNRREVWRHPNPQDTVGLKLWDAPTISLYPQHKSLMHEAVAEAAAGQTWTSEIKMERAGVPTAYLDVSIQPIRDDDGAIIYLLFEARDVTDLRTTQEQLRQSQKMEALGQLTGGIAHDFNNLLTVVVGGLDLIVKRVEDDKLKTYASNALLAAERGARLTGQLLAFSRVQKLEVKSTAVGPLVENMRPLLKNVLGPGVRKKFDLASGIIPVMADPTQLELAVLNLAINARDAMPGGGTLTIRTRQVDIEHDSELADGAYIELSIEDSGTGMTEEVRSRAFEPFFTTKEVGHGTGLGLSMVYGVARQSGGTARIRSKPGSGTCVSLFFRCAEEGLDAAKSAPARDQPERVERAGASVLIIDDDPDVRTFIAESLADLGYTVRTANGGESGLASFEEERPDVVILDFIMPGLSGAEVAQRILAVRPDQKILFVSGYSETESIRQIAPDAPLLNKPFRAETLDSAIEKLLPRN